MLLEAANINNSG